MKSKLTKKQREKIIKQFDGRMPTKKEIFERIKASQERMMQALAGAARTAPDDPEARKQLLEVIERTAKLRSKIYKQILKEKPPKVRENPNESN